MGWSDQPAALLFEQAVRQNLPAHSTSEELLPLYEEAFNALWRLLAPLLGHGGTRAIFERAVHLAARQQPLAGAVGVGERGLDLASLRQPTAEHTPHAIEATLSALAIALADILAGLIGVGLTRTIIADVTLMLTRWTFQQAPPATSEQNNHKPAPKPIADRSREDEVPRHD